MNSVKEFMSNRNENIGNILREFSSVQDKNKIKVLRKLKKMVERQIFLDEQIIYPVYENKMEMHVIGPTSTMREEHTLIKEFLDSMDKNIQKGEYDNSSKIQEDLNKVLMLHTQREESMLYGWIDSALEIKDIKNIIKNLR